MIEQGGRMNRRSLLTWIGLAPAAGVAAKLGLPTAVEALPIEKVVEAASAEAASAVEHIPVGLMRSFAVPVDPGHNHPFTSVGLPNHTHGMSFVGYDHSGQAYKYAPMTSMSAVFKQQIYDGERWVDFDSPDGSAVFNKLIATMGKANG